MANDDFPNGFPDDEAFNKFKEMINRMLGNQIGPFMNLFNDPDILKKLQEDGHVNIGFSLNADENGNVNVHPFNPDMIFPDQMNTDEISSKEPFFDLMEDGDQIVIVGDVSGYTKDNIHIGSKDSKLVIKGNNETKSFNKEIEMPSFDPKSVKAKLRNGTLEITVKTVPEESGHKITIE